MNKNDYRTRFRNYRKGLTETQRFSASQSICKKLEEFLTQQNNSVLLGYLATGSEVTVDKSLQWALERGIKVYVPTVLDSNMRFNLLTSLNQVSIGSFGIRESCEEELFRVSKTDEIAPVILIPGVAFDSFGNRLGQGAGYYDRFLTSLPYPCVKVGVCFSCQYSEIPLPKDDWDVSMDFILTEEGFHDVDANSCS